MSTKHTAGPWAVSPFGSIWAPFARHDIVASLERSKVPDAELAANARLIAAAPELVAAVSALIECHNTGNTEHALAMGRAVLLKLKGQKQ